MQRRPLSSAERWCIAICGGLGVLLAGAVEQAFTMPAFAAFVRRLGIPVSVPSQPIGIIEGFDFGLVLSLVIGAWLGAMTGYAISRVIVRLTRLRVQ